MCVWSRHQPGGNARMAQFFRGNLAGLMIRTGKLENKNVIDCLYTCKEGLDVQLPEEVASAVKVTRSNNKQCSFGSGSKRWRRRLTPSGGVQPQPVLPDHRGRWHRRLWQSDAAHLLLELPPVPDSWHQAPSHLHHRQVSCILACWASVHLRCQSAASETSLTYNWVPLPRQSVKVCLLIEEHESSQHWGATGAGELRAVVFCLSVVFDHESSAAVMFLRTSVRIKKSPCRRRMRGIYRDCDSSTSCPLSLVTELHNLLACTFYSAPFLHLCSNIYCMLIELNWMAFLSLYS